MHKHILTRGKDKKVIYNKFRNSIISRGYHGPILSWVNATRRRKSWWSMPSKRQKKPILQPTNDWSLYFSNLFSNLILSIIKTCLLLFHKQIATPSKYPKIFYLDHFHDKIDIVINIKNYLFDLLYVPLLKNISYWYQDRIYNQMSFLI